jgi:hypothetical protein
MYFAPRLEAIFLFSAIIAQFNEHQLDLFAPSNGKFEVVVFTDTATEVAMVCGISGQRIQ